MRLRVTLIVALWLASSSAFAQNQAQQNLQQQQWQQEQTRRGYQAQQDAFAAQQQEIPPPAPQPSGEWIKTWGAIANGSNGEGGVSVGQLSKTAAENEAIKQCIRGGGVDCKSTFYYHNQCVAILTAVSNKIIDTVQGAESVEAAKKMALPVCRSQNNGSECEVAYSACSEPIFKRY